jgi:hypothetical protein
MRANRSREGVRELLEIEEADAWFDYLNATRDAPESRYVEVERWAWVRLRGRLHAIRMRRGELVPVS